MTEPAPVRREVVVAAPPATAFALFTATSGPGGRWPTTASSAPAARWPSKATSWSSGSAAQRTVWAEVLSFDPPNSLELSWHPGQDASRATELTVRFTDLAARRSEPGAPRLAPARRSAGRPRRVRRGWPVVLEVFQRAGAGERADGRDWYVLLHQPGPALAPGRSWPSIRA